MLASLEHREIHKDFHILQIFCMFYTTGACDKFKDCWHFNFLGYAFAQLEAPTAYMSNDFSAVSYLNVKTGKTYPRTTGKIKLFLGRRIIVDKASAFGAKGPGFKTRWRPQFINL